MLYKRAVYIWQGNGRTKKSNVNKNEHCCEALPERNDSVRPPDPEWEKLPRLQAGSPYGLFRDLFSNS